MFEDLHIRRDALKAELNEGTAATIAYSSKVMAALRAIEVALGESIGSGRTGDPIFDRWEEALDRGQIPNLKERMADLRARGEIE